MASMTSALDPKQLIYTGTASQRGRNVAVHPDNSSLEHLGYGRIRLDVELPQASFETGKRETALMCMKGACRVSVDGAAHDLDTYDAIYIPRGSKVDVSTTSQVDLV